MPYDITLEELAAKPLASIRYQAPISELPRIMGEAYGRLFAHVGRHGGRPTGEALAVYHEFDGETVDVEVAVGVAEPVAEEEGDALQGRIFQGTLPGGPAAHTVHFGPYDTVEAAYIAINAWIQEGGREPAGPPWEVYRNDPNAVSDPSEIMTDIYWPVR